MRTIKFRAWNKDLYEPEMIYFSLTDISRTFDGGMGKEFHLGGKNQIGVDGSVIKIEDVMQFTGLLDKNGKEIYEGDIVKTDNENYPIQIVQYTADLINTHDGDWDEWRCGFDLRVPHDEYNVLHYQLKGGDEVIGNIYENPELAVSDEQGEESSA